MKRLLLLSSLIFGLALSGCGNGNNNGDDNGKKPDKENTQKAKLGETCTKEKACETGLACALLSGQTDKGKCETACDNGTCTGTDQECKTDVAGLEGKTVKVCREKSTVTPPDPQKKELGQPCTEPTECKENLVCVADAGKTDKGKCQTACPQNTCTDGTLTCQNVDGLNNSKVDACLTPKPQPNTKKEGEECAETDTCETGTHCVAKHGRDDVGICKRATACPNRTECTGEEACQDEDGLGGKKLQLCGSKWCTEASQCPNAGDVCISDGFNRLRGICKPGCDPKSPSCPTGQACTNVSMYTPDYMTAHICMPKAEASKKGFNDTCNKTSDCRDKGMVCAESTHRGAAKCVPTCETIGFGGECYSGGNGWVDFCLEWDNGVKACGPIFDYDKYYTQEKDQPCGTINNTVKLCKGPDLECVLPTAGAQEGKCVKIESKPCNGTSDTTTCGTTEKCESTLRYGNHLPLYLCK